MSQSVDAYCNPLYSFMAVLKAGASVYVGHIYSYHLQSLTKSTYPCYCLKSFVNGKIYSYKELSYDNIGARYIISEIKIIKDNV